MLMAIDDNWHGKNCMQMLQDGIVLHKQHNKPNAARKEAPQLGERN